MKSTSLLVVLIVVLVISLSLFSTKVFASDELDGRSYEVKLIEKGKDEAKSIEKGKDEAKSDELIFNEGNFISVDCKQYGFSPEKYIAAHTGDSVMFKSSSFSEKEGIVEWRGKVNGDKITGTMTWYKPGQDPISYDYKGKIKKTENTK